jgi:hypothetical protein
VKARIAIGSAFVLLCGNSACSRVAAPPFPVLVVASIDDETPLEGVHIFARGRSFGETNASGELTVALDGVEGERVPLNVVCPAAFRGPEDAPAVRLARIRPLDAEKGLRTTVVCRPNQRKLALVVVARHGAHVDVVVDGKRRQTTDDDGVAHVLVEGQPGAEVRVAFDTSEHPNLAPPGTFAFRLEDRDRTALLDEDFASRPNSHASRRASKARPTPYRIR